MLQARHNPLKQRLWLEKGGKATLKSYSEGHLIKIPESHWDFLGKVCINSYELPIIYLFTLVSIPIYP